ncbi:MAG: ATP-binding protein [Bacteroidota bacterium]
MDMPTPETRSSEVLALLAPEVLAATVSAKNQRLGSNAAWDAVFGSEGLWDRLSPEDRRFAGDYVTEAATGALITHQMFLIAHRPEELPVPVLLNFLPVHLPHSRASGRPVVITGEVLQEPKRWATDQTKRRRMEMLGQMAMGIAHDFNNLLTSILGHVELLKGALDEVPGVLPATRDHPHTIERAALDGAALVRKIQRYIRHEKKQRFDLVDLASILDEVASLTRPYWYNEPRGQGIAIELVKELGEVPPVRGVEPELRDVFVNLILNAVQAMPDGGTLTLRTRLDGSSVVAQVDDTGVGMTDATRQHIFEPLFTTKGENGTGMGLAVAYGIVQEHSGDIDVASTPGEGTRFSVRFPVAAASPLTLEPAAPPAERRSVETARLLVVDDERMVRDITVRLLRSRRYEVQEASGGTDALRCIADEPFDLIVTDLGMPEMSGSELAYRIKQHHPHLPIVLLSGHTDAEDQAESVDAVVRKPFQIQALDETIQGLLAE